MKPPVRFDPPECGLITSGTTKATNWLLREQNMDAFCKHLLREAWKFPKPEGATYKVRIEILRAGQEAAKAPEVNADQEAQIEREAIQNEQRADLNG